MDDEVRRPRYTNEEILQLLEDIPRRNREAQKRFRERLAESKRLSDEGVRMQREAARRARRS